MSKKLPLLLLFCALIGSLNGQTASFELPLWTTPPTESNEITAAEQIGENGFITNVSVPTMTVYPADPARNTGAAVLIAPGGGYGALASHHEGSDFAAWFAENGITGVVLKYRLPNRHRTIPLTDAQEAMRLIRRHAAEWKIDPAKVGVMGSSAGGHLASTLLTHYDAESRPDFGLLFYPVITFDVQWTHHGSVRNLLGENPAEELREYYSNEKQVTAETPPTLIFFSDDDKTVPTRNGTLFYDALNAYKVPATLYIFPSGGHGWGFRETFRYHEMMKSLLLDWLKTRIE